MVREPRSSALTLVETLVALMLCSALASVGAVIVVQTQKARAAAITRVRDRWERMRVFDQFEQDVEWALAPLQLTAELTNGHVDSEGKLMQIIGITAATGAQSPHGTKLPASIVYLTEQGSDNSERKRLIREVRFLTDPRRHVYRDVLADELMEVLITKVDSPVNAQIADQGGTGNPVRGMWQLQCRWKPSEPAMRRRVRAR